MSQTHRYSLADYTVNISYGTTSLTLGGPGQTGEGTFVGSISVSFANSIWNTESDPTGSWIHSKNLARNGTISININQISDDVLRLISLCWEYYSTNSTDSECCITISKDNSALWQANSCYINKMPEQLYGASGSPQQWIFTCGQITPSSNILTAQNN